MNRLRAGKGREDICRGGNSKIIKNILLLFLIFFVGTQDICINKINPNFQKKTQK
jgi:hypothetical protein